MAGTVRRSSSRTRVTVGALATLLVATLLAGVQLAPPSTADHADGVTHNQDTFVSGLTNPTQEDFERFAANTAITTQIPGVSWSTPSGNEALYVFQSSDKTLFGGYQPDRFRQVFVADFAPSVTAVGFNLEAQDPTSTPATVEYVTSGGTVSIAVSNTSGNESTPTYVGFRSTTGPITKMTVLGGQENGSQLGEEISIDDLAFESFTPPPGPGPSGGIVFSSNRSGQFQIWTVVPDTGAVTQLTSGAGPNTDPYWSPDGSSVAFVSQRDGNPEIYKINVATGAETRLTNNPGWDADPAWSPDGSRIAFTGGRAGSDGEFDVYEIPSTGETEAAPAVNLTNGGSGAWDSFPSYDRNGNLLFQSMGRDGADFEIFRRIPDEIGTLEQLTVNDVHDQGVHGSPANRDVFTFATENPGGTYSVHVLDRSVTPVKDTVVTPAGVNADTPTFGPDGRTVAYVDRSGGQADLKILPADGGSPISLAATTFADEAPNWFDSIVLTANVRSTKASPPAVPLPELRLQEGAPDFGFAPIPGLSLAPIPALSLAPIPGLSLAPIPGLSLAPIPGLSLAPIPGLSLAPIPALSLAPIPGLSLAPAVAEGYDGVLLSSVPLNRSGGWPTFLVGTPLEGEEPAATSFLDLFQKVAAEKLATLHFGELDFSNSKLGAIHHSSVLLGRTPLSDINVPEENWDWCTRLGQLGFNCADLGGESASLVDLQVAGVPFNDPTHPIHVHATKLANIALAADAPIRGIQLPTLDLGRLNLGAVTTDSLQNRAAVVSCASGAADCNTLAQAQDAGHLVGSSRFEHLLGSDANNLTLGEITFGFLPLSSNPPGAIDLHRLGVGAYDGPGSTSIDYSARFVAPAGGSGGATSLIVDLPRSAFYVPGSTSIAIDGSSATTEPVVTADVDSLHLTWEVPAMAQGSIATIDFEARPGITIGQFTSGARMISPGANLVATNRAPVQVGENHEDRTSPTAVPDNDTIATAAPITTDTLVVSHMRAGDKDFFSFPAPPAGSRIRVDLGHLRADLDLVLYHPADAKPVQPLRQPKTARAAALAAPEQQSSLTQFGEPVMPEPGQDLALENLPVAGLGDNRGVVPEVASAASYGSGTYVVQVAGHLGAFSDQPYSLRLSITPPRNLPACTARSLPSGTSAGWTNAGVFPLQIASTTETLFLVNKDRLADRWGATEADRVVAELNQLRTHSKVQGEVLPVDGVPAVRSAYEAWDANPCDPELANDVVRKINAAVDAALPAGNQVRHIVLVGSSEDLPDSWLPDLTSEGNEALFMADLPAYAQGNNVNLTGAARGYLRSLDPYGDLDPEPALNGWTYASDLGLGRLGEDPDAIVSASARFREFNGLLDAESIKKTLTTGTDFFDDLGTKQDATFEAQRGDTAQSDLIGSYTAGEVRTALGDAATGPGIVALNGHGSPTALEAAAPAGSTIDQRVLTASQIAAAPAPDRRLVLSIGCHTGYTQPDVLFSSPAPPHSLDWSQAFARQGGLFVGQTGYGIGIRTGVALSEDLMAKVVNNLDGSMTVGEALTEAKQAYKGGQLTYGAYDTKVVHEAVLSGLPMYEVRAGVAPAGRPTASLGTDAATGLRTHDIVSTPTFTTRTVTGDGTYSEGGTGQIVEQNRPLQPKVEVDLPKDPALPGHTAHGVVITGLVSSEREADPVLASVTPGADLPESQTKDVIFPAVLQNVTNYNSVSGPRQSAVLAAGQFTSTGLVNGKTFGIQRDFVRTDAIAYYSDSTDFIKPEFQRVDGAVVGGRVAFSASVTDMFDETTPGEVKRVVVVYRPRGSSTWSSLDLLQAATGSPDWNGSTPITGTEVEYFAQAVDAAGNVAVTTRKGAYFLAQPLPQNPTDIAVQISGGTPVDGWYDGASVTLTGAPGEVINVSLNGGTPVTHDGPIVLGGEQVHRIDYRSSLGHSGSLLVPVDTVGPRAVIRSPRDGAAFVRNQSVIADYSCVDAGVGVGSGGCDGTVADGSPIDTSTIGSKTVSIMSPTDRLGNTGTGATSTYTVDNYTFEGFFDPIENAPFYNVVTGGQTVPVKFRLTAPDGSLVTEVASVKTPVSVEVSCPVLAAQSEVEDVATADATGVVKYDAANQQFIYNWKTDKTWAKSKQCRKLTIEFSDGTSQYALFQFK